MIQTFPFSPSIAAKNREKRLLKNNLLGTILKGNPTFDIFGDKSISDSLFNLWLYLILVKKVFEAYLVGFRISYAKSYFNRNEDFQIKVDSSNIDDVFEINNGINELANVKWEILNKKLIAS